MEYILFWIENKSLFVDYRVLPDRIQDFSIKIRALSIE